MHSTYRLAVPMALAGFLLSAGSGMSGSLAARGPEFARRRMVSSPDTATVPSSSPAPSAALDSPFAFPPEDPGLEADLREALSKAPFARLVRRGQLSVSLVDLSRPDRILYSAIDDDRMRYAASLPKIGIMLGVFTEIDAGNLEYTPALRDQLELMIRRSDNKTSSDLIRLVGFERIEAALRDPRWELYDVKRNGGLWVGRGYGSGLGLWRRDPLHSISHGATSRQVARFMVMMDRGELISPWASAEMKRIAGHPEIQHKFVLGLQNRPSLIFRKSGTYKNWHADAAIVERGDLKYVAVALVETNQKGVLSKLIVELDDIIARRHPGAEARVREQ
jgi:beta-lactamase class A